MLREILKQSHPACPAVVLSDRADAVSRRLDGRGAWLRWTIVSDVTFGLTAGSGLALLGASAAENRRSQDAVGIWRGHREWSG